MRIHAAILGSERNLLYIVVSRLASQGAISMALHVRQHLNMGLLAALF